MFSRPERLSQRTPIGGVDRFNFLKQLVEEFKTTKLADAKEQVLANLANFSYDPINYQFLRTLSVIDLFLDQLAQNDSVLSQFAIGGLCNLVLDPENKDYIIGIGGINAIKSCLYSSNEETVLSAITTLMYLMTPESKSDITSPDVIRAILPFADSKNKRLKNLTVIFLEDYCSKQQVELQKKSTEIES